MIEMPVLTARPHPGPYFRARQCPIHSIFPTSTSPHRNRAKTSPTVPRSGRRIVGCRRARRLFAGGDSVVQRIGPAVITG